MAASLLSPATVRAVRNLLRASKLTPSKEQRGGTHGRIPLLVRCTSTTPAGGGVGAECYPAVVVDPHSNELVADQPELGEVWLTLLEDGGAGIPVVDTIYHGVLSGDFDPGSDNRPRVFGIQAAGAAAGSIQVEDVDESPSVSSVTQLRFDSTDGFVVSSPGAGIALVDMQAASGSQAGIVSLGTQALGTGHKSVDSFQISTVAMSKVSNYPSVFGGGAIGEDAVSFHVPGASTNYESIVASRGIFTNAGYFASLVEITGTLAIGGGIVGGATGTFTTVDGKTVTVTGGVVTSIV